LLLVDGKSKAAASVALPVAPVGRFWGSRRWPLSRLSGSYFPVGPLPIFRGDPGECPDAHLARFDRVCRANIFTAVTPAAAARIFTASLEGDATLWYDLTTSIDEGSPPSPWHAVRASFLDFFRLPDAAKPVRVDLVSLRQGPSEVVNRYHLRIQRTLPTSPTTHS